MPFAAIGLDKMRHGTVWGVIRVLGFRFENDKWIKAGSKLAIDRFVTEKLVPEKSLENFTLRELLDLTKDLESRYTKLLEAERTQNYVALEPHKQWINAWKELYLSQFSKVDEDIWSGIGHVVTDDGAVMCVCKTGNGNQYRIIGNRPEELVDWMAGMYMPDGRTTRLAYIQEMIVKRILEYTIGYFSEEVTDISLIDGSVLSAAAMGSLYVYKSVMSRNNDAFIGYRLDKKKDKITALSYIETSLETFMARHEYRVQNISIISNNPTEPTYLYIPVNGKRGDWSEWNTWMNEGFAEPTGKRAFMGWIGALLDAKNGGKQCLWLHGRGNDGKSVIANILSEYFGQAAVTLSGKSLTNQFGGAKLENKRLVIFADGKNQKLLQSELMHNLTGGDSIDVERKGKNSYSTRTAGKLLVCANYSPEINTDEINQVVRLIYIRMRKKSDEELIKKGLSVRGADGHISFVGSAEWPERLRAQLHAFLTECSIVYREVCPTGANILVSKELSEEMMASCGDPQADSIEMMCSALFESDMWGAGVPLNDLRKLIIERGRDFGLDGRSNFIVSAVNSYLFNTYSAQKSRKMEDGKRVYVMSNIKLKEVQQGL